MPAARCVPGRFAVCAALAVVLASCVTALDEEESRIGDVRRDCLVPLPTGVASWGAPVSLETPVGSRWIWEVATLQDGSAVRNVTALVRTADEACAGDFDLMRDGRGRPLPALELSDAELAANASRTDGRRLDLVPQGGFAHSGRGFLYYEERLSGPGVFDSELLGQGLCVFEQPAAGSCTRLVRDGTTRLWGPGSRPLNRGGFVDEAGFALLYGCERVAAFEDLCIVARVPVARVGEPAAYRFYNPFGGWIEDPANAGVLFRLAGRFTVRRNEFLGVYTAIGMDPWSSSEVVLRSAEPTGGFGPPDRLFDAVEPASFFPGGGVEHAALSEEQGRTVHVSYFTNAEGARHGLHLVTFRFLGGAR